MALFSCPLDSAASSMSQQQQQQQMQTTNGGRAAPRLAEFIAYALHRTRLPLAVTHQALFLLKRLKSRFPAARGSSGHRLFISALMLASKSSCDDTYSNKSWTVVGQGLFTLREVNQMERELFGYLGYKVNVENEELEYFVDGLHQGKIVDTASTMPPQTQSSQHSSHPQTSEGAGAMPLEEDDEAEAEVDEDEEDEGSDETGAMAGDEARHSISSPCTSPEDDEDDDEEEDAKFADVSPTTVPGQYHGGVAAVAIPNQHYSSQQQQQQHHHQPQQQQATTHRDVYHQQAAALSAPNIYSSGLSRSASVSGYSLPPASKQSFTMPAQTASLDAYQHHSRQQSVSAASAAAAAAAAAAASYQRSCAPASSRGSISSLSGYSLASGSMTPSPSHTGSSSCTSPETPASELTGSPYWTNAQEARIRRASSNSNTSSAHTDGHFAAAAAPVHKYGSDQYGRLASYPQHHHHQQHIERAAQEAAALYRHQQQYTQHQHQHSHQDNGLAATQQQQHQQQQQRPFGLHPDW